MSKKESYDYARSTKKKANTLFDNIVSQVHPTELLFNSVYI